MVAYPTVIEPQHLNITFGDTWPSLNFNFNFSFNMENMTDASTGAEQFRKARAFDDDEVHFLVGALDVVESESDSQVAAAAVSAATAAAATAGNLGLEHLSLSSAPAMQAPAHAHAQLWDIHSFPCTAPTTTTTTSTTPTAKGAGSSCSSSCGPGLIGSVMKQELASEDALPLRMSGSSGMALRRSRKVCKRKSEDNMLERGEVAPTETRSISTPSLSGRSLGRINSGNCKASKKRRGTCTGTGTGTDTSTGASSADAGLDLDLGLCGATSVLANAAALASPAALATATSTSTSATAALASSSASASASASDSGASAKKTKVKKNKKPWVPDEVRMVLLLVYFFVERDLKSISQIAQKCSVVRTTRAIDKKLKRILHFEKWNGRVQGDIQAAIREICAATPVSLSQEQVAMLQAVTVEFQAGAYMPIPDIDIHVSALASASASASPRQQ